jgi:hypothetical protein
MAAIATFLLECGGDAEIPLRMGEELLCSGISLGVRGVVLGGLSEKMVERSMGLGYIWSGRVHSRLGAGEGGEGGRGLSIGYGCRCRRCRRAWVVVLEASKCKLALALSLANGALQVLNKKVARWVEASSR